jgi:Ca2+-binding RTX toxin-like protein
LAQFLLVNSGFGDPGIDLAAELADIAGFAVDPAFSSDMSVLATPATGFTFARFNGTGLTLDPLTARLTAGQVTAITWDGTNGEGTFDSLRADAARIGTLMAAGNGRSLAQYLLRGNDSVIGTRGDDVLQGLDGKDRIFGDVGDDTLEGGKGNDRLDGGGGGQDVLFGGRGSDSFDFTLSVSTQGGVTRLADFDSGRDRLRLDKFAFGADLPRGQLDDEAFVRGRQATTDDHRLIYNPSARKLLWDDDGAGGADAIVFASLGRGHTITADDIFII